jgi:hypothetical protein
MVMRDWQFPISAQKVGLGTPNHKSWFSNRHLPIIIYLPRITNLTAVLAQRLSKAKRPPTKTSLPV